MTAGSLALRMGVMGCLWEEACVYIRTQWWASEVKLRERGHEMREEDIVTGLTSLLSQL